MNPCWKFEFRNLLHMTQECYIRHQDVRCFKTYSMDVVVSVLAQQPTSGRRPPFRVSKSYTIRHTYTEDHISGPLFEISDASLLQTSDVNTVNLYHGSLRRPLYADELGIMKWVC